MKRSQVARIPRLPKELRDKARRDEIVEAARACVVRHGFHAASMAEIAAEADMSVGQIYRYFASKEAIVHAIVERIVEGRLKSIVATTPTEELPAQLAHRFIEGMPEDNQEDRVLMLEVSAEATRSEAVAEIVRDADRRVRERAVGVIRSQFPALDEKQAQATFDFLACLSEGTFLRQASGLRFDERALGELYQRVFHMVLSGGR